MFFALCVLFTGSFIMSCTDELDEYKYDDEYPEWLGASIYDFLKDGNHNGRTYNNLIAIIDKLGYSDILARTGSKTIFVADDDAFARFYGNNKWGVSSFEDLTITQMKILLFGSMLDNTYLLDMMSCLPSSGGADPVEGTCIRRDISLDARDSVPYFTPDMLPKYNKYWDDFRTENGGNGLLLALDATEPMMVHLLREFVKAKRITERDINIIFNADRSTKRSGDEGFIYGNQIIASDIDYGEFSDDTLTITCKNGFVYRMNNVLVPPSNMAQELRQHPNTKIFSHLLDRFSAPILNKSFSEKYNEYHGYVEDTKDVYVMRYLNYSNVRPFHFVDSVGQEAGVGTVANGNPDYNSLLPYDPGWNRYVGDASSQAGADMAAMLVPSDEAMYEFFANGAGKFLLEQFAPNEEYSREDLTSIIPALDSIPLYNIGPFLEVLMLSSFVDYVPSKFDQVYDQGSQDPLNIKEEHVDECIVANNGVIYILNNAFAPAKYRSVSAPPSIMDNMLIMREAINQLGYDAYLLAMGAQYTFFVPDDEYFVYYDPVTIESQSPLAYKFSAKRVGDADIDIYAVPYIYNPVTYELSAEPAKITKGSSSVKFRLEEGESGYAVTDNETNFERKGLDMTWSKASKQSPGGFLFNRFTDLLDYLIVLGDVEDGNKYYRSKGYGTIKCDVNTAMRDSEGNLLAEAFTFYGGEQLENGKTVKVMERFPEENGVTYCTMSENADVLQSGIPTPPTQSIYSKLKQSADANGAFSNFYKICMGPEEQSLLEFFQDMYPDIDSDSLNTDSVRNYSIFYGTTSKTTGRNVPRDMAVPFFNSYHYTLYVPNNEAIEDIYAMGLPTWEELQAELGVYDAESDDEVADGEDSDEEEIITRPEKYKKVAAYVRLINKFVRYHFQDYSIFVDNNVASATYETAALNDATGRFFELELVPGPGTMKVLGEYEGNNGRNTANVVTSGEENKTWNIMTRDLLLYCNDGMKASALSEYGAAIETSSFAVVHEIDRALLNSGLIGFDGMFRRYADGGGLIDKVNLGGTDYIVEHCGKKEITLNIDAETETVETVASQLYNIMRSTGSNDKLNKEEYILDEFNNKYLIDKDGCWCARVYDEESETYSYRYVNGYDEEGNYITTTLPAVRISNTGQKTNVANN